MSAIPPNPVAIHESRSRRSSNGGSCGFISIHLQELVAVENHPAERRHSVLRHERTEQLQFRRFWRSPIGQMIQSLDLLGGIRTDLAFKPTTQAIRNVQDKGIIE